MKAVGLIKGDLVAAVRGKFECILRRREWGGAPESAVDEVFGVSYPGFREALPKSNLGDLWVGLSHLIWLARRTGRCVKFSFDPSFDPEFLNKREALVLEILRLFKAEREVEIVRENITRLLPVHPPRNGRIVRIIPRSSCDSHLIAYQFDGISRPDLNPTPEEVSLFLSVLDGHQVERAGLPKTLSESFDLIERAGLFIGVCSGMSHIAATLGKACLIYFNQGNDAQNRIREYTRLKRWHPYRGTRFFSSAEELARLVHAHCGFDEPVKSDSIPATSD
jgi:hypothetical protein